jgi:glycosyltransferase involved in cell wall biosynthesis
MTKSAPSTMSALDHQSQIASSHQPRRPRVLLVAESANPKLTSVALIGWSYSKALAKVADVHLVAELRNQADIEAAGIEDMEFTPINNRRWQGLAWNVAKIFRGGTTLGWGTYSAMATLAYPAFERRVWKQFGDRIKRGEFDVVHRIVPNSPITPSLLASKCAQAGVPFVLGPINGGVPWPKEFKNLRRAEREWLSRFRDVHKLMPGFHATRRDAAALVVGAKFAWSEMPERYHHKSIYLPENAIDADRFPRQARPEFKAPLRIAFVGRLVPMKGADMLIEAAAPLARAGLLQLDIIGDGPEMPKLRKLAADLNITEHVEFPGWVDHTQLADRLRRAQVFGFPSVREFGGGVVLEAMALGLVPVVLNYGGPAELVTPETGFTLPMGPRAEVIHEFSECFARINSNPSMLQTMSQRAQEHVFQNFTWDAKARQMLEVYHWTCQRQDNKPDWGMPFGVSSPTATGAQANNPDVLADKPPSVPFK